MVVPHTNAYSTYLIYWILSLWLFALMHMETYQASPDTESDLRESDLHESDPRKGWLGLAWETMECAKCTCLNQRLINKHCYTSRLWWNSVKIIWLVQFDKHLKTFVLQCPKRAGVNSSLSGGGVTIVVSSIYIELCNKDLWYSMLHERDVT